MKWKFNCHKCGQTYTMMHRSISKDKWLSGKKEGRPYLTCIRCRVKICGELIGNRK